MTHDLDWRIRLAAFAALSALRDSVGPMLSRRQMDDGFVFEGRKISFAHERVGIWRPAIMKTPGAALSITTAAVKPGTERKYDDQLGGEGPFEYRYQRNPNHWHNAAVRKAFELNRPVIYFYGVTPGIYEAVFPAYIVSDSPSDRTFGVAVDAPGMSEVTTMTGGGAAALKEYATRQVKYRLHQHRFRELVLGAYGNKCTICRLAHVPLLDAAHIIADRDQRGLPEVPNGLSLCKIHHSAYDANILGITPECRVEIRRDILDERDGPMLRHGLQELDGEKLRLPRSRVDHPNPDYLKERYTAFCAA